MTSKVTLKEDIKGKPDMPSESGYHKNVFHW
jgi:hypothetical protein